ncbi:hypothetical protein [Diaphorobacter nitroreducens]|uniref:hypothetical protein n=1 Tax=Diaphorobacter nitroreducens TaxID=164759 RepID=UPI0028AE087C|nr:hypothetical protein [Diaphorobacter nitroreducens]
MQVADQLERWKSIASIASAIAIPFVLAIVGYFIQKQLANEGLKKDYVSIAAGILKENPEGQEPDLRKWAVEVLEKNSPIPFTAKARQSLEQGLPIILPGPALPPPIADCMEAPKDRTVSSALTRLEANVSRLSKGKEPPEPAALAEHFMRFVDTVVKQEEEALSTRARLICMQSWAKMIVESDNDWRRHIGAPDSASVFEQLQKEKASEASAPKNSMRPEPSPKP